MRSSIFVAALAAFLPLAAQAQDVPEGNVLNGRRLFNQCRACHTINEGGRNGVGPNLHGVIGRQMASVQGFNYSPRFREQAGAHGPWTEENLRPYLGNLQAVVPGTHMAYPRFRGNQQNISDVALSASAKAAPANRNGKARLGATPPPVQRHHQARPASSSASKASSASATKPERNSASINSPRR